MNGEFKFRVSSALKNIIGRDLITDDYVAVFELVKNSIDAYASRITLQFSPERIVIADDGKGMTRDDIENKWLFVAYSAKREGNEDDTYGQSFRDRIRPNRKAFAGNKGVGRFSCDRLGARLRLQSRPDNGSPRVEMIDIDWTKFENDSSQEFIDIPVAYSQETAFTISGFENHHHGTLLEISNLRSSWDRSKLLKLKEYLAKLIDPFGVDSTLGLEIIAPDEREKDESDLAAARKKFAADILLPPSHFRGVVNGPVENFIFTKLEEKTTYISVNLTNDGKEIHSCLVDRGEMVYEIVEDNPYQLLRSRAQAEAISVSCKLYYLNRSAKRNFALFMGLPSVQYGNVFLFCNGFRVYPVGEPDNDAFGLDRRKAQGYARHVGTRDLLGQINVQGSNEYFRESSSRDKGLVETPEYIEVESFFMDRCLKRLEAYVVGVTWADKPDKEEDTPIRVVQEEGRARVVEVVSKLVSGENVRLLHYSGKLLDLVSERSESFENVLSGLQLIAAATGDQELSRRLDVAEVRWREAVDAERQARESLEQEREARMRAERAASLAETIKQEVEQKLELTKTAYEEEKKRSLFLASVSAPDYETIVNLHHQIVIVASGIGALLDNRVKRLLDGRSFDREDWLGFLESLVRRNQEVLTVAKLATRANFRLDSSFIEDDLIAYMWQYVDTICVAYQAGNFSVSLSGVQQGFHLRFKPIDVSILMENMLSNAKRAKATNMTIEFGVINGGKELVITFTDNGRGIDGSILEPERIFEKGFTTTSGSGLGLYHVRGILNAMGGSIALDGNHSRGARFMVRVKK
jgi:signal transduction histidine kinase